MRGERHVRRAGVVSAGTLALVLTGAATPAAADETEEQRRCADGDGLLSTVTGAVCNTADSLTGTTKEVLDETTGDATKDLTSGVRDLTGGVTGTLHDTARAADAGLRGNADAPSSPDSGGSSDDGSDTDAPSDGNAEPDADNDSGGRDDSRRRTVNAAGSPTERQDAVAVDGFDGSGAFPHLQPLSPLAGLDSESTTTGGNEPKLPRIAPSPTPSPRPTPSADPDTTHYVAPAADDGRLHDRGEATPALMVLLAVIAAGAVTSGHVAIARARIRSRRVD